MRIIAALLVLILAATTACGDDDEGGAPTPSASTTSAPASSSLDRPDPQSLIADGFVLDETLDVALDGSDVPQILVISHTTEAVLRMNDPTAEGVPPKDQCDSIQETGAAACLFQAEVFALDDASRWVRTFVTPDYESILAASEKSICGHRCGIQEFGEPATFALGDGREVVILAFGYCTGIGSGCGVYHEVLTMQAGDVNVSYTAWQAGVTLETGSATFDNPATFRGDAGCCPGGRRIEKLALDSDTGELAVVESRLILCTEGRVAVTPEEAYPQNALVVRCDSGSLPSSTFETSDSTVVEPAKVGGVAGLRAEDHVRVEYSTECEADTYFCSLIATTVTVVTP